MQARGCIMRATDVERVRSWLQRRRRLILETSWRAAADIDELRGAPSGCRSSRSPRRASRRSTTWRCSARSPGASSAQIDAALARLEAGRYGTCRSCGDEIDEARVEVLPFVLDCAACATDREEAGRVERERELPSPGMLRG